MTPLYSTWIEFKEVFREECINKGLEENKKILEIKIEEIKSIMTNIPNEKGANVSQVNPVLAQDINPSKEKKADKENTEAKDKKKGEKDPPNTDSKDKDKN